MPTPRGRRPPPQATPARGRVWGRQGARARGGRRGVCRVYHPSRHRAVPGISLRLAGGGRRRGVTGVPGHPGPAEGPQAALVTPGPRAGPGPGRPPGQAIGPGPSHGST